MTFLQFTYCGENGLTVVAGVLPEALMGLFDCPDCVSFKEFRGIRPGRNDFLSEKGRSCSNTRDTPKCV